MLAKPSAQEHILAADLMEIYKALEISSKPRGIKNLINERKINPKNKWPQH